MSSVSQVTTIDEFNQYYQLTNGLVRAKNPDFHIYRLSEIGKQVVAKMGPFKINYFHLSLGSSLHTRLNVFDAQLVAEDFTLVIFVPGQVIEWERTSEWQGYAIDVKESFLRKSLNESLQNIDYLFTGNPIVIKMSKEEFNGLVYLYELIRAEYEYGQEENISMITHLLHVLLIYVGRIVNKSKNPKLRPSAGNHFLQFHYFDITSRFKSLVMREYTISKSVSYYAERLAITPALLNKSVKLTNDKTAKQVINEVLLLHAKSQLNKHEVAIKDIATQLNFDDYSHFVKFFKSMTGLTPADYRQNQK